MGTTACAVRAIARLDSMAGGVAAIDIIAGARHQLDTWLRVGPSILTHFPFWAEDEINALTMVVSVNA